MFRFSNRVRNLIYLGFSKRSSKWLFQSSKDCTTYVTKEDKVMCLKITKGWKSTDYHYLWLRDHCRCDFCYDNITYQRKLDFDDIPFEIKPKSAYIDKGYLKIHWEDDHKSEYLITWLERCLYENYVKRSERQYKLWTKGDISRCAVARMNFEEIMKSDRSLHALIKSFIDYGVGFVENVPPNVEGTEEVVRKIGPVQNTLFGGMWEFSDSLDHSDTAYTKQRLDPHTDNTYFTEAAGLQVLHCIAHDGHGGENILVDGFIAASILKEKSPDVYDRLTRTNFRAEYIENEQHHLFTGPIIKLNPITKQIDQIRFNLQDRAPVVLPHDEIVQHYKDLRMLAKILKDPDLQWTFKLKPGTVLIFDNFRVLHGRTEYTGKRVMCGCYIGRSDFLSKARTFKLIDN